MNAIHEAVEDVVYVNDRRLRNLDDVLDAVRYLHEFNGVRFVILDYLQLVWIKGRRENDILDRIQEVSGATSATAKDLGVVLQLGLSQFNRQTSANRQDPPSPQGLMGSPLRKRQRSGRSADHSRYERVLKRIPRLDPAALV